MDGQATPPEPTGKLAAYVRLFDPGPVSLVLLATVGFAALAARGWPPVDRTGLLLLAVLCNQSAIALHNHYCDRHLDAVARPWRAIPRGLVPARRVAGGALALAELGMATAFVLGPAAALLVAVATVAGFAYNAWLKRTALSWLPFWVAVPGLPLCAFAALGRWEAGLPEAYLLGLPLVLAIHLADALSDAELDARHGVRGLAQRLGYRRAQVACWLALGLALALVVALRPAHGPPVPLYLAAGGLWLAAVALGRARRRRAHWLAVMSAALFLALAWAAGLAG